MCAERKVVDVVLSFVVDLAGKSVNFEVLVCLIVLPTFIKLEVVSVVLLPDRQQ